MMHYTDINKESHSKKAKQSDEEKSADQVCVYTCFSAIWGLVCARQTWGVHEKKTTEFLEWALVSKLHWSKLVTLM